MENLPAEKFKQSCNIAKIISGAVFSSTLLLILIVEILRRSQTTQSTDFVLNAESLQIARYAFYGVAFMEIIMLQVLRKALVRKPQDGQLPIAKLQTAAIITAAMSESIAIMGAVLYFIGKLYFDFYIFLAISAVLQLIYFPTEFSWRRQCEE